jgi:hypothetical protein
MSTTSPGESASRYATAVAALSVGLLTATACGLGHVSGGDHDRSGTSYALDTAAPAPRLQVPVRIHGHMGRPGLGPRRAAAR